MKVLHLTLKKQWFDMILHGIKKEEYREIKEYWNVRLDDKSIDVISFRNGYSPNSPRMVVDLLEQPYCSKGNPEWGAPEHGVWILRLGDVLSVANTNVDMLGGNKVDV